MGSRNLLSCVFDIVSDVDKKECGLGLKSESKVKKQKSTKNEVLTSDCIETEEWMKKRKKKKRQGRRAQLRCYNPPPT